MIWNQWKSSFILNLQLSWFLNFIERNGHVTQYSYSGSWKDYVILKLTVGNIQMCSVCNVCHFLVISKDVFCRELHFWAKMGISLKELLYLNQITSSNFLMGIKCFWLWNISLLFIVTLPKYRHLTTVEGFSCSPVILRSMSSGATEHTGD